MNPRTKRSRWSRRTRILSTTLAVLALATGAWAAVSGTRSSTVSSSAANLDAPFPSPQDVLIQKRSDTDGLGNAYVLVHLTAAQVSAKRADGTLDFLTLGTSTTMGLLRNDGQQGDLVAGDTVYTGITTVDLTELQNRAAEDQKALSNNPGALVPLFSGRAAVGVGRPEAFDYTGFADGKPVRLGPAVAFLEPEKEVAPDTESPSEDTTSSAPLVSPLHSSGSPRSITSGITFLNPITLGTNNFQDKVLMITNTSVIADPTRTWNPCNNTGAANGVWTFNHLMTQMANQAASGIDPSDFVQTWLNQWLVNLNINNDPLPARLRMNNIVSQWPKLPNGKLDLSKSPLRLLAIAPRLDLRQGTGGGGPYSTSSGNFLNAGELRFVFAFVAKKTSTFDPALPANFLGAAQINNSTCFALPFSVIFEYRVAKSGCQNVRTWAQQWKLLKDRIPGTALYNNHLQTLTQQVVTANADPTRPNGSSISQVRTNEVALNGPWELREFRLTQSPFSFLLSNTVEDTIRNDPGSDFNNDTNGTGLLLSRIQNVVKPLLALGGNEASVPLVPLIYLGQSFLAGDSRTNEPPPGPGTGPDYITFHWSDPNMNFGNLTENWARHRVSRAACNGCHRRETFTHFVHVNPANTIILSTWDDTIGDWTFPAGVPAVVRANPALPAELSRFLTGINQLGDPADAVFNGFDVRSPNAGAPKRNFDDLARRELDLNGVAGMSCSGIHPINLSHVRNSLQTTGRLPANLFDGMSTVPATQRIPIAIDDIRRNVIFEVH